MKRPLANALALTGAALAVLAGTLLLDPSARAEVAPLTEGRDFAVLAPQKPTAAPAAKGKTEVIQFFSYGCPHCAAMRPHIAKWAETLPANVQFVRVPVAFGRPEWGALSRAYYTLMNLGELQRLDATVFESIHAQRNPIFNEAKLTEWAVKQGIDAQKFRTEYNSDRVSKAVLNAEMLTRDFAVDSIPKIIVGRRYKVVAEDAKSYDDLFATTNRIIDKAVKEQAAKR